MNGPADRIGIIASAGVASRRSRPQRRRTAAVASTSSCSTVPIRRSKSFRIRIVNWAQLGRATAALKRAGVSNILVLGAGARPSFRNARPDFAFFRALPAVLRLLNAGGDDAVLRGFVASVRDARSDRRRRRRCRP